MNLFMCKIALYWFYLTQLWIEYFLSLAIGLFKISEVELCWHWITDGLKPNTANLNYLLLVHIQTAWKSARIVNQLLSQLRLCLPKTIQTESWRTDGPLVSTRVISLLCLDSQLSSKYFWFLKCAMITKWST